ncbi:MAG: type I-E CRISPR-associated protein Cse2/CasB [Microbacteriaceae bacterium]
MTETLDQTATPTLTELVPSFVGYVRTRQRVSPAFRATVARALTDPAPAVPMLAKPLVGVRRPARDGLVLAASLLCRHHRLLPAEGKRGAPLGETLGRLLADRDSTSARVVALESMPLADAARQLDGMLREVPRGQTINPMDVAFLLALWHQHERRRAFNWAFHARRG